MILKFWLHSLLWCWKVKFISPETIAEKLNVEGCKLRVSGGAVLRGGLSQLIAHTSTISLLLLFVFAKPCALTTLSAVIKIPSY